MYTARVHTRPVYGPYTGRAHGQNTAVYTARRRAVYTAGYTTVDTDGTAAYTVVDTDGTRPCTRPVYMTVYTASVHDREHGPYKVVYTVHTRPCTRVPCTV